jgi:hypothetical protein
VQSGPSSSTNRLSARRTSGGLAALNRFTLTDSKSTDVKKPAALVFKQEIDMTMKNALTVVAAVAAAMFAQATFAQASAPLSRADVKAETKAAAKAGQLTPAGEGSTPMDKPTTKSTKTRAERKAETKAAVKAGAIPKAGEISPPATPSTGPTASRADVKADTKAAVKAGTIPKAGEAPLENPK